MTQKIVRIFILIILVSSQKNFAIELCSQDVFATLAPSAISSGKLKVGTRVILELPGPNHTLPVSVVGETKELIVFLGDDGTNYLIQKGRVKFTENGALTKNDAIAPSIPKIQLNEQVGPTCQVWASYHCLMFLSENERTPVMGERTSARVLKELEATSAEQVIIDTLVPIVRRSLNDKKVQLSDKWDLFQAFSRHAQNQVTIRVFEKMGMKAHSTDKYSEVLESLAKDKPVIVGFFTGDLKKLPVFDLSRSFKTGINSERIVAPPQPPSTKGKIWDYATFAKLVFGTNAESNIFARAKTLSPRSTDKEIADAIDKAITASTDDSIGHVVLAVGKVQEGPQKGSIIMLDSGSGLATLANQKDLERAFSSAVIIDKP